MAKKYLNERKWINPSGSYDNGWYKASVEKDGGYITSTFMLADCSRTIALSFDFEDKKGYTKSMKKIELLKAALGKMEAVMLKLEPSI